MSKLLKYKKLKFYLFYGDIVSFKKWIKEHFNIYVNHRKFDGLFIEKTISHVNIVFINMKHKEDRSYISGIIAHEVLHLLFSENLILKPTLKKEELSCKYLGDLIELISNEIYI
jgi:hypothetical protein